MSDWGIDWDGPVPVEDSRQQTDIPMTQTVLREMLEAQLQGSIDPFKTGEVFDVDIYQEALNLIVLPYV